MRCPAGCAVVAVCAGQANAEKFEKLINISYARAATVATEALSGVKTVTAFGRQKLEMQKYIVNLAEAEVAGRKKGFGQGLGMVQFKTDTQSNLQCCLLVTVLVVHIGRHVVRLLLCSRLCSFFSSFSFLPVPWDLCWRG